MAKRSRSYRRSIDEMKRDSERAYHGMEKFPSEINPIFLNKPYSACEPILRGYMGEGKEKVSMREQSAEKRHKKNVMRVKDERLHNRIRKQRQSYQAN